MSDTVESTPKKRRVITIRVSPTELAIITKAAQAERLTLSEYIRRQAIVGTPISEREEYWDGKKWVRREAC